MIRTTLSVCALLASLLLVSRWVVLSSTASPSPGKNQPTAEAPSKPATKPAAATTEPKPAANAATTIKVKAVAGAPFKMPDGCVEIQCGDDVRQIEGVNTDGSVRVAVAEYLHGPIPVPHDYVARVIDFEEEPSDETDDVFGFLPGLRTSRKADANPIQLDPVPFRNSTKVVPEDEDAPVEMTDEGDATVEVEMTEEEAAADASSDEAPSDSASGDDTESNENPGHRTKGARTQISDASDKTEEKPEIELTPELIELREKLRDCLAHYYYRPENVASRSPWGAMHYMLAYGVDSQLIAGDRKVNAVGWMCYNGVCNGQNLFWAEGSRLHARIGVGVQGHAGQFLAMLAQSKVPTDFPIKTSGRDFTVADLIQHEKDTCKPNTELTFKLIALTHYCKSDERWTSDHGEEWDIPRLIKEELRQPIVGAACGGTHRLMGFSYAVRKRQQRKEEFTGQWLRAKKFIDDYHEYTFRLQNPDGSFSTEWFAGRGDFGPPGRRLETTGHITEWLSYSLSDEQLVEPRMVKSVTYLTNLLHDGRNSKWNIGPLGHGLHALAIYDERVFGGKPGQRNDQLASHEKVLAVKKPSSDAKRR